VGRSTRAMSMQRQEALCHGAVACSSCCPSCLALWDYYWYSGAVRRFIEPHRKAAWGSGRLTPPGVDACGAQSTIWESSEPALQARDVDAHATAWVVRLEWRRVRPHSKYISHSFLLAHLSDGRRLRFEVFQDDGYTESRVPDGPCEGEIYDDRVAHTQDLIQPIMEKQLRRFAHGVGGHDYSLESRNCHHFVRELWNGLVKESERHRHYPDRMKVHLLRGVMSSFGNAVFQPFGLGSSLASSAPSMGSSRVGGTYSAVGPRGSGGECEALRAAAAAERESYRGRFR